MFKKKKELVKDAEKPQRAKAKTKKVKNQQGKGLLSWIYQPSLVLLLCFCLSLATLDMVSYQAIETTQNQKASQMNLAAAKHEINTHVQNRKAALKSLASDPYTDQGLSRSLQQVFPDLVSIYSFMPEQLEQAQSLYQGISFASIDLLRRTAKSGKAIVEAYYDKEWFYQVSVPQHIYGSDGKPELSRYNLAVFRANEIKELMKRSPIVLSGRYELITEQGKSVISVGQGIDALAVSEQTAIPQWKVRFSPSDSSLLTVDRTFPFIAVSVIALLGALILFVLLRIQANKVRKDIQASGQYITRYVINGKASKTMAYGELISMSDAVCSQLREFMESEKAKYVTKSKAAGKAEEKSVKASSTTAEDIDDDAPLFDDDLLDLDELNDAAPSAEPDAMVEEVKNLSGEIAPEIFRAYDIRGIVDETLNDVVVELIGKAIATEAIAQGQAKLCIGFDGRLSSVAYCQALARGITSTGVDVIIVGQVPTPVLYFATHHFKTGSGVMITGSHNPSNYNGFKIMLAGKTLSGEDIQKLYNRIVIQDFAQGEGSVSEQAVVQEYMDTILNDIAVAAPLKVVIDAGNGVAGGIAPELIEELGCEVIPLHCDVDGNFPNHHPDPGKPENLQDMIAAVQEHQADLGLAFDGDGDRLGIVTNSGKIIWPDRLLMLFAKDVVSRNPGADILFDVKCSRRLNGLISSYGGRPIMWKTGHSLMKAKMQETGALLAGEMSGHIFFKERWFGFDDGIYSAVRLLELLGIEDRTADEVFADFPEDVSTPEINIPVSEDAKFALIEKLSLLKGQFEGANVSTIDGLRVDYPNGWGLCRASNTTPVLVLRFEADDEASLEEIKNKFKTQLQAVDPGLDCSF